MFMKLIYSILTSIILLLQINISYAWPTDNKVEKNVRPNQSVKLFKMYFYNSNAGCGPLPTPQVTSDGEKLGKVSSNAGKEKITKEKSPCNFEFEANLVEWIYTASSQSGTDKFKLYYHTGASFASVDVTVNITGNAVQSDNASTKKTETQPQLNNKITQNGQIVNNPPLSSNPFFEKIKTGSVFYFQSSDLITNKDTNYSYIISDKNTLDFSTTDGTVFNTKFERVKSGNWKHNTRACDGLIYPLVIGASEKFNHDSVFVKDNISNARYFNCERKIIGKKIINVSGKYYDGWVVENKQTSKWNNGDTVVYNWIGVFSEEIDFWIEINISERVADRLTMSRKVSLVKFEIPSVEYQIKTTMCSGSCDTVSDNQKASITDSKKFKNRIECEQNLSDFQKQSAVPVAVPTSFTYTCVEVK